jgi:hypothetical protein
MNRKLISILFFFATLISVQPIYAREIDREPYKKTTTFYFHAVDEAGTIKVHDKIQSEKSKHVHITSSNIKLEILDVKNASKDYWEIKYKANGYLYARVYKGQYSGSRTTALKLNGSYLSSDYRSYTDNSQIDKWEGKEHSIYISKNWDNPFLIKASTDLYAYTYDAWSSTSQYASDSQQRTWNMNYAPNISNSIDRTHMNGKDSTSITVNGKVYDTEQDDITITAEIKGTVNHQYTTLAKKTKYIDMPNTSYGQGDDYEFTFNLSEFPKDVDGTLYVTAMDHFKDISSRSYPIYIDRTNPVIYSKDTFLMRGGSMINVSTTEQSEVYLLKNDSPYNLYSDIINAISTGKGTKIGTCTSNSYLSVPSFTGSYRLFAVDRGKNVSAPSNNIVQIDSQKPKVKDIIVEDNEIIIKYFNQVSSIVSETKDYLLPLQNTISSFVCVISDEDNVNYEFIFNDYETDKKYSDRFICSNFDNSMFTNKNGIPKIIGNTVTNKHKFHEVGKYSLEYQAQDTPIEPSEINFSNYRKWSNKNNIELLVHRRPIADLTIDAITYNDKWIIRNINGDGYDLDHMNMANKGIIEEKYEWKSTSDDIFHTGKIPSGLPTKIDNKDTNYIIKYMVKDIEGAWSNPKIYVLNLDLKFNAKLKSQNGQPLNHVSTGQNLILYDATTICPYNVHLELALYDQNGTNQILDTKTINYNSSTGIKNGTKIQWNDIDYYIPKNTKEGWYTFKATAISADNQQITKQWKVYLVDNTPPTVQIIGTNPSFIYEGDDVFVNIKVHDFDMDTLNLKVYLLKDGNIINTSTYTVKPNDNTYNICTYNLINNITPGNYEIRVVVNDNNGGEANDLATFIANDLNIKGYINHTSKWNENRIKYNQSKTNTDNSPRDYDTYWSGEKFMLSSTTTSINSSSTIVAETVYVEILNESPNITQVLHNDEHINKWTGELWNKNMIHKWGTTTPEILTFRFTVEYSNSHIEIDDVNITIDDIENYWRYHRKF